MYTRGLRNRQGTRISLNGMSTILNNPFYTGIMRIKKTGELFPGKHQPFVSTKLFDTVQCILRGKTVPRASKHDFVFRKLVRCRECQATLIAELQKGHVYYRCHTRQCETKTAREERIDNAVGEAFGTLRLDEEEMSYVRQWFANAQANHEVYRAKELDAAQLNLAQVRDRLGRLTDAYLDGAIDKIMLDERRNALLFEDVGLKKRVAELESGSYDTVTRLEKFLELVQDASNLYRMALPLEKRDFVKKLTSNLGVERDRIAVELKNGAQLIANRNISIDGGAKRRVHRTWDPLLTQLLALFEKDPGLNFAPNTD
jgi:site-specific DNA recombinase